MLKIVASASAIALGAAAGALGRRRARRRPTSAQALLDALFEHSGDGLIVQRRGRDGVFRVESCNAEALAAIGRTSTEVVGQPAYAYLPPDVAEDVVSCLAEAVETGRRVRRVEERASGAARVAWEATYVPVSVRAGVVDRVFVLIRDITQSQTAERAAHEANRLLRAAEQIARVGNWRMDFTTRQVVCSDEVYRIYGGQPSDRGIPLLTAMGAYHPSDQARVRDFMAAAAMEGTDFEQRVRLVRPDGVVRHVIARGICEKSRSGEVTGLFGVVMDITDLVAAEAAMRESHRMLSLASQVARMGHWQADLATGNVVCSGEVYDLYDLDRTDPVTMHAMLRTYHPDDRPRDEALSPEHLRPGFSYEAHRRVVAREGKVRHVLVRAICETRQDGGGPCLFGVTMDITALKQAELTVQESEARYRVIADDATDLFGRFAPDSTVLWVSPAVREILGYAPEALVGTKMLDLMHPDDVGALVSTFHQMVEAGSDGAPTVWQYRARHADGRWIWLEGRPRASFDPATGEISHLQDVIRDISARKQTEERLAAAQLAAEAAAGAKSEFLATMSHELRTPLTSIIGFAGLLQGRGQLGETEARFVRRINDASRMLLTVVNDVLEFSKLEAGKTELESRPFGLRQLVDDAAALIADHAAGKGLALSATVCPEAPDALLGDSGRLSQVLLNLLNNAVKFTASGSVALEVTAARRGAREVCLTFSVTDTGPGVPGDRLDRLFQRFSQADGSMSRRYGGTGLGLAICRGLVELMQGQIGVDSTEGSGSRFWFTVPLPLAPAAHASIPSRAEAAAPRAAAARVLVADDSEANRELIRLMVTALGHDVDLVDDGEAAVEAVRSGVAYDLVLMDVHMPVLDGLLATRRIRALGPNLGGLPIIALTADVLPEQIARCREAGLDDHLAKPIAPAALNATLARWLARREESLQDNVEFARTA